NSWELPAARGPYHVEVIDGSDRTHTGGYSLYLQRVTEGAICDDVETGVVNTPLPCDKSVEGAIDQSLETDLFSFNVGALGSSKGELVEIFITKVSGETAFNPYYTVRDRDGTPVGGFYQINSWELPAARGPYHVEVIDDSDRTHTGQYSLYLQRLTESAIC